MDWGDIIHVLMKFSKNSVRAAAGLRQEGLETKRYEQWVRRAGLFIPEKTEGKTHLSLQLPH